MNEKTSKKYIEASLESYKNCMGLLKESELLLESSRFARSYALAVLCLEEFAKSFLYRCVSVEIVTDKEFPKDLRKHEEKMFHGIHLVTAAVLLKKMKVSEHEWSSDKNKKSHSDHKFPKIMNRLVKELIPETNYIVDILKNSSEIKKKAFYVEIKDSLIVPDKEIEEIKCIKILKIINDTVPGFDYVLELDDKKFKELVLLLDPQIMTGTIKSD